MDVLQVGEQGIMYVRYLGPPLNFGFKCQYCLCVVRTLVTGQQIPRYDVHSDA